MWLPQALLSGQRQADSRTNPLDTSESAQGGPGADGVRSAAATVRQRKSAPDGDVAPGAVGADVVHLLAVCGVGDGVCRARVIQIRL